nr:hypothetical protein [Tanacetum cinerariifolium]
RLSDRVGRRENHLFDAGADGRAAALRRGAGHRDAPDRSRCDAPRGRLWRQGRPGYALGLPGRPRCLRGQKTGEAGARPYGRHADDRQAPPVLVGLQNRPQRRLKNPDLR